MTNAKPQNEHDDENLDDTKTLQEALDDASDEQVKGFVTELEKIARDKKPDPEAQ